MFRRRLKLSLIRKVREMLWPSMGWGRTFIYMGHRLTRLKETTYSLAMGLSVGAAISFTPTPGAHILQAAGFSWILRSNVFASFLGTLLGNPWTLPFMWWASYKVGEFIFKVTGFEVAKMPEHFTWAHLVSEIEADPLALFLPWLVGGYVVAIVSLPVFYAIFHLLVLHARARQAKWKQNRVHKYARQITEQHE